MKNTNYGEWLLNEIFGHEAKSLGFFDSQKEDAKDRSWDYFTICRKDLGWTGDITFAPDGTQSTQDRDQYTKSQYQAFVSVMSSIQSADLLQDKVRLGSQRDDVVIEEEQALQDMRHYLDIVAALMLKYGPYEGTRARTLDLRMGFINELMHYANLELSGSPSLGQISE